jgi:hypothetical protein
MTDAGIFRENDHRLLEEPAPELCDEDDCEEEGIHELGCLTCGGIVGRLCDEHIEELERRLVANRAKKDEARR